MNFKHIQKTHTLQLDQSDCGVACLLSIIKLYGGNSSIEKLREASGTTKQGTTLLGLYQAAQKIGFTAEGCEADIQALIDHKQPVILHVVIEKQLQHYVVCYGLSPTLSEGKGEKMFIIGDPAKGVSYMSENELDEIWVSKSCLTLEPNDTFVQAETEKNAQRKWFFNILQEDYKLL